MLLTRKGIAASAVIVGLVLLFGGVVLDIVMERHTDALVAGGIGAALTIFATAYHGILPPQRGHRQHDRTQD
jgi:hypothetical protein